MLIEFSVTNYRSIKDEALLSLVANPAKEHFETHIVNSELGRGLQTIPLLRSAAIYGANASGKTNFIWALLLMKQFVVKSHTDPDGLDTTPFLFDSDCKTEPTTFEVACIVDSVRYQYGFSATRDLVTREWLYAWPRGRIQTWFERDGDDWKFGSKLAGDKEVWRRSTRSNALFLSTAASLNSTQLQPIFDWFKNTLHVAGSNGWGNGFSIECCNKDRKTEIIDFMKTADLAIADLRITEEDFKPDLLPDDMPSEIKDVMTKNLDGTKIPKLWFIHETEYGKPTELTLGEESDGTKKLFALAGPWLDTLKNGLVVIIDELHENLHPTLVRFLVEQFHNPHINTNGAQLVFSTHDTSILSQDVFRRDQIWFCERNDHQETRLFPLSDFRPRKELENLERSYLAGRYGALPYVHPKSFFSES